MSKHESGIMTKRRKINLLIQMLEDGVYLYRACKYLKLDKNFYGISQELKNEIFALQSTQSTGYSSTDVGVWFDDFYSVVAKKKLQIY